MLWINFLHLYQPGNASDYVIEEATEKSYLRIVRALEEHPDIKFTLNINGCLLSRWENLGYSDLFGRIKKLVNQGQVELVGTASFHPILPLISAEEAIRQIKDNEATLKKYFGGNFKPRGFFMPEMAYGAETAKLIKNLGYEYLILDEIAYSGKLNQADFTKIYLDKNSGLKIIFRSRKLSNSYVPKSILKILRSGEKEKDKIVVTATDAELYGLRFNDPEKVFENILNEPDFKTLTVSGFMKEKSAEPISILNCSWESTEKELKRKEPYMLWQDKKNSLQNSLWELAEIAQKSAKKFKNDKNKLWVDWHLSRGLASCMFWWASGRDLRQVFGPIAWSPNEIEKGANDLVRSIRSIADPKSKKEKLKAEKTYLQIIKLTWPSHWKKFK